MGLHWLVATLMEGVALQQMVAALAMGDMVAVVVPVGDGGDEDEDKDKLVWLGRMVDGVLQAVLAATEHMMATWPAWFVPMSVAALVGDVNVCPLIDTGAGISCHGHWQ
jgi:hypothetical protein